MKKTLSIVVGCLMITASLFGCARGRDGVYPTATPAARNPRSAVTQNNPSTQKNNPAPYRAMPRATTAPRANTAAPRNLVPRTDRAPGAMNTPNITPYGQQGTAHRSGVTAPQTMPRTAAVAPRDGINSELEQRTTTNENAPRAGRTHTRRATTRRAAAHRGNRYTDNFRRALTTAPGRVATNPRTTTVPSAAPRTTTAPTTAPRTTTGTTGMTGTTGGTTGMTGTTGR